MNYRKNPRNGDELSILAFGCMRFNRDEAETKREISYAIENGVNYFDTAYIYPGNEATLGRLLTKEQRDKIKIATKMPPYFVKSPGDFDKIFTKQLGRLKTDRIDYYLIHMLVNEGEARRLAALGLEEWLEKRKRNGDIVNVGFSYHGGTREFKGVVDARPWDFVMIQYNYYDEFHQAGRAGLEYASGKGLPVMVMEPLRGGALVNKLPGKVRDVWDSLEPKRSPAEWALRWVWNHPEVTTVLSGMNSMEMIKENIRVASEAEPNSLSESELEQFKVVRALLDEMKSVPCTGCNYCMPCPFSVDIPQCFEKYNGLNEGSKLMTMMNYIIATNKHNASLCTKCGACEKKCPQGIKIRDELDRTKKVLEGPLYKPARFFIRRFMKLEK